MRYFKHLTAALTLAAGFGLTSPAWGCPLCKDSAEAAVDMSGDQNYNDNPSAEARSYNQSIYMMIGVPYTIFAVGGFYCYRHLRGRGITPETGK